MPDRIAITVGEGHVHGTLRRPAGAAPSGGWPAVLVCHAFPGAPDADDDGLRTVLADALVARGLAVAEYTGRDDRELPIAGAHAIVNDAVAVFRWLITQPDVDADRTGVLGFRLGAIAAAAIAARTERVARLCLVSPFTAEDLATRIGKGDADHLLVAERLASGFAASLETLGTTEGLALHERPTLIMHAAADAILPLACPRAYLHAAEVERHMPPLELIPRADHAFADPPARAVCCARVVEFFGALCGSTEAAT